jgi:eukaryotic-like serine/threonine-protein kinase
VRGEAYLAAHQGAKAAAEFLKIVDHRGIVLGDPVGALARLQLGRAFGLAGVKAKARTACQDFLTLWKDADPDIPILREAKGAAGVAHHINLHHEYYVPVRRLARISEGYLDAQ